MSILKKPVVTEKASMLLADNKYTFVVAEEATKIDIKREVQSLFGVNVKDVNIIKIPGKVRRRGRISGKSKDRVKAIVTLDKDQSIDEVKGLF